MVRVGGHQAERDGQRRQPDDGEREDGDREPQLGAHQAVEVDVAELGLLVEVARHRPGVHRGGAAPRAGDPDPLRRAARRRAHASAAARAPVADRPAQQGVAQVLGVPPAHLQLDVARRRTEHRPWSMRTSLTCGRATRVLRWMRTNPASAHRSSSTLSGTRTRCDPVSVCSRA